MSRCLTFMGTNQHATLRTVSRICRITLSAVSEMGTPPSTSAGASGACPAKRDYKRQPDEYTQVFTSCHSAALLLGICLRWLHPARAHLRAR